MSDFVLSCESTADLNPVFLKEKEIEYVCFHFEISGEHYSDDMGKSMALPDFYRRMKNGEITKTSQVSVGEYTEFFENFLKAGKDILHVSLSSGISGTYNSAMIAAEELRAQYPERQLLLVDSLCASSGYGLLMSRLAALRDQGYSITEARDWAEAHKLESIHWFFTGDLTYLIRGGRISKTAGHLGMLLNICPLMHVDTRGALAVKEKIRTKRKVMKAAIERMKAEAEKSVEYDQECFISNAGCYEDARAFADMIEETFPKLKGRVRVFDIGTTIGSHTGPGLIAFFFWGGKARED